MKVSIRVECKSCQKWLVRQGDELVYLIGAAAQAGMERDLSIDEAFQEVVDAFHDGGHRADRSGQ